MPGPCCSVFTHTDWQFFEHRDWYTDKQLVQVWYFWLVGVFFQVSALVFSDQTQADMMRKGPLTSRALSKLVLMQSLDLVPLYKFTKLLALGAHFWKLTPWVHMWSVTVYSSVVAESHPQHLSLERVIWAKSTNGPKTTALFSANHCHHRALWVFLLTLFPFFMKQSTLGKEGWWGLLQGHNSHMQLLLHPAPPKHSTITPETVGTAARSWGVCWRSYNKFVDK